MNDDDRFSHKVARICGAVIAIALTLAVVYGMIVWAAWITDKLLG